MLAVIGNEGRFGQSTIAAAISKILAAGALVTMLSACGGDGETPATNFGSSTSGAEDSSASGSGSGGSSTSGTSGLDCTLEGYPCSFSEVPLPVIEQSLSLSEEAAQQLEDGVDIEQVAAFLTSQNDVVDVTVDGPVLGFRMEGGRPMIVDVSGDQEFLPAASAAAAGSEKLSTSLMQQKTAAQKLTTVRTALSSKITSGNTAQRHALVLSPFRYEENFGNSGEQVASALDSVRGYAGNVTYLETTNEFDPQVTVDVLTQLEDYDVIHIDTHGGTLCKKKDALLDPAKGKDKKQCENGITDFLVQRFHGTAQDLQSIDHPGVVHYRGRQHQSIAVTADFFRHYYPEGLTDKLFILGSCNTFRTDMADAIAGSSSIYVSWDGYTEYSLVKNTSLTLLDSLGLGLTVNEAFARLPSFSPENPEATGTLQHTPRQAGGDLRIRDLLTVRDNLTGKLVTDASGIEVMEEPEDGQNDHLNLELTVDGITPEQLGNFYVNLVVENQVIGHLNLKQSGVPVGDFSYRVSTPVPLPFDVKEGQALSMDLWIPLPDLGEDHFIASPKVNERNEPEPEVGSEWMLSSRTTRTHKDSSTLMTASVEFELEPDDDPASSYHYFRAKSGTVRIQRDYEDTLGCRFNIDHTIEIPAGAANNYLRFDASGTNTVVNGFGKAPSENIEVTGSCGDKVTVQVGGVYFMTEDTTVSGDSISGAYNDGAALPTIIEWTLDKTQ